MPTISYAITACNESKELKLLLDKLLPVAREEDEIIIQYDSGKVTSEVQEVALQATKSDKNVFSNVFITSCPLHDPVIGSNFANFKNHLRELCKKDYIFFIDADEYPSDSLLHHLALVLENNPIDLFVVPRVNTVEGLTAEHIAKWRWRVDDLNRVNWPDFQTRIIRNEAHLKWEGAVHERIVGAKTISHFPTDNQDWALYHPKTIQRQEQQNEFYNTI